MCEIGKKSESIDLSYFVGGTRTPGKHIINFPIAGTFVIENGRDILIEKIIVNPLSGETILLDFKMIVGFVEISGIDRVTSSGLTIVQNPGFNLSEPKQTILYFNKYYQECEINKVAAGVYVQCDGVTLEFLTTTSIGVGFSITVIYSNLVKP